MTTLDFLGSATKLDSLMSLFGAINGEGASKFMFALAPLVDAVLPLFVSSFGFTNICCDPEMFIL